MATSKDQILRGIHIPNVSFLILICLRICVAGNIAYNLKQLGGERVADHGHVGPILAAWLTGQHWISSVEPEMYTAQAIIMTDMNNNQITAFHPGAMANAHPHVIRSAERFQLAILGPDSQPSHA